MSNLAFRFLTAAIGVPVILAILYLAPLWGWYLLCGASMAVAAAEFFGMTHPGDRPGQVLGTLLSVGVFSLLCYTRFGETRPTVMLFAVLALVPLALLFALARPRELPTALPRTTALVFGPLYVGAGMAALAALRTVGTGTQGAGLALMTMMIAWFSDTGGYFAGKNIGGPKLYPEVSPNKTWSGGVGGVLGSMLGAAFAHFVYLRELPLVPGLLLAAAAGVFGQVGDFCESALKRSAGVKDSGGILPGHGGILDRVDALLFAALVVYGVCRAGLLQLG
ncbi:MAG: phosphatidate cytidylyltransferase [Deltaproteobacteria bacterium]|nr:phosphatidate cytidylyltransferase [Deltaproteobacteria bacterium]